MSALMVWGMDEPRARYTDPIQSHIAATYSQKSRIAARNNILTLVRENPFIIGVELNDLYDFTYISRGWKRLAPDSPRKRAGDYAAEGLLLTEGLRDNGQQYLISAVGLDLIA